MNSYQMSPHWENWNRRQTSQQTSPERLPTSRWTSPRNTSGELRLTHASSPSVSVLLMCRRETFGRRLPAIFAVSFSSLVMSGGNVCPQVCRQFQFYWRDAGRCLGDICHNVCRQFLFSQSVAGRRWKTRKAINIRLVNSEAKKKTLEPWYVGIL